MKILISNSSPIPIYEQIKNCLIEQIITQELHENEPLPSIRSLAKDIQISVMTIKKAYDALEKEGYIISIQGKGTFVAPKKELVKERAQREMEEYLEKIVEISKQYKIPKKEIIEIFNLFYEEG